MNNGGYFIDLLSNNRETKRIIYSIENYHVQESMDRLSLKPFNAFDSIARFARALSRRVAHVPR